MSPVKKVTVSKLKTTTENKFLKIDIKWIDGGGNNPWSLRGVYVSVSPVTIKDSWNIYVGFSGSKMCLETAGRFSQKLMDKYVNDFQEFLRKPSEDSAYCMLIQRVLDREGLQLEAPLELSVSA